jgi:oligopeptide/dipeptide ABC transporter ATP-binding protein
MMLRAADLVKDYPGRSGRPAVRAVRGVSLELRAGETLGIVGESGCGKSTLARLLVGLEAPTSGTVEIEGSAVSVRSTGERRQLARRVQLVFQDPFSSLDPRLTVEAALGEVLKVHELADRAGRSARVGELLDMVALGRRFASRYPHELSGGQAQRVAIARALAVEPKILVLDEPTSALDVSVRAEVVNLLVQLQDGLGLAYIFISHDLGMVRHVSDQIAVMYLGRVVESGPYHAVLDDALHPYTRALAAAVPVPDPQLDAERRADRLDARPVAVDEPAAGCPYEPRCPLAEAICAAADPSLLEIAPSHRAACHVAARRAPRVSV